MKTSVSESTVAATVIAGARCALVIFYASAFEWPSGYMTIPFDQHLLISIAFATFLTAFLIWRRLPREGSNAKYGAAAGFLAGIVSHPVTWLVYFLIAVSLTPAQETGFQLHKVLAASLLYAQNLNLFLILK